MSEYCKNCQRLQEEVERLTKALREIGVESHHPSKQFESGEIDDDEYAEGNEGSLALIGIWANKAITRTNNLRELAKRAVKQSELDKNATPAEIDAWADKLAKSAVECGEDEVLVSRTDKPSIEALSQVRTDTYPECGKRKTGTVDESEAILQGGSDESVDIDPSGEMSVEIPCPKCTVDFIFLDQRGKPYRCKTWGDGCWLFYWHSDKKWVSHQAVTDDEVAAFPRNLSPEEQEMYMKDGE